MNARQELIDQAAGYFMVVGGGPSGHALAEGE